ncbi:nickel transporter [Streptomyces sp. NPDC051310]|uniref:nickel transporter n=1 Tax=Streptomyces sp. NPDC051310 TaxID=3365649 RepID=UPI00378B6943
MTRRTTACALATLVTGAALALLPAPAAQAHPLGNFTVNQYDGLVIAPGTLRVDHVEDLAEIPASQERNRIDADGDARLAPAELASWARSRCDAAAGRARLTVGDGAPVVPVVSAGTAKARVAPGQAGLVTLRVTCELTAPLPRDEPMRLSYRPADVSTGAGWREITARGDRMTLAEADVPGGSSSRRLTAYPDDLLSSPPDSTSAALSVRPGGPALAGGEEGSGSPVAGVLPRGADRWAQALTSLVARHELTLGFAALALGAALVLGAGHAMAPGHGKTMMAAAAAAGGRSSLRDMLALGASVTLTHTLGVFALGALITAGSAAAPTVVAWLGVISGSLVALAGALLLRRAWRRRHRPGGHSHGHEHPLPHQHTRDTGRRYDEERVPALMGASATGRGEDGPAGSRSATAGGGHLDGHDHAHDDGAHSHGHEHEHGHEHTPHSHDHPHHRPDSHEHPDDHTHTHATHSHAHADDHDHEDVHGHVHGHHHGRAHTHTHTPPAPGLRGLILLGLAGGLVPSPSAVVVLIGAAALGEAWFGFLLVLAYGAGLALTLAAAGFTVVRLRDTTVRRLARRRQGRVLSLVHRMAPLVTASAVLAIGCGLVVRAAATALA